MRHARKLQQMRGEVSTLIIAGVLVVAGVGVLLSSTLSQNKQSTNTKAAEGCVIESISADLSGGICKFTINYTPTATNPSPRDLVCALINPKRDPNIAFNQLVAEQRSQLPAGWDVFNMSKNGRIPLFAYSKFSEHLNPTPDGGNYRLVVYDWRRIQSDPTCVRTVDIPSGTVTSIFGGGGGGTENPANTPVPGGGQQPTPTTAYNVYLPIVGGGNSPTPTRQPVTAENAYFTCEGKGSGQCFGPATTGAGYISCEKGVASGRENCGAGGPATTFCTTVGPGDHCDGTNIVNCKGVGANPTGAKDCKGKGCSGSVCNGDPTPTFTATPTPVPAGQATSTHTITPQPVVQPPMQITINTETVIGTCTNTQVQAWISANILINGRPLVIPEATCTALANWLSGQ